MQRDKTRGRITQAVLAMLLAAALGGPALAQFGGPPGGPGGGRGMRMGMGMRGPRPLSAANAPLAALAAGLHLTGAQQAKIGGMQRQFAAQRDALMPRPGGGPPDFGAMRAGMEKVRGLDASMSSGIASVLTAPQRAALPGLLKTLEALRTVGLPAATYGGLNLTPAQKGQITALAQTTQAGMRQAFSAGGPPDWQAMRAARQQATQRAMALLTGPQQALVRKYEAAHPRRGGFGGPPPGGFGGPPPGVD